MPETGRFPRTIVEFSRQQVVVNPYDEMYVQQLALEALAALDTGYDALERSEREDVRGFALDNVNMHAPALKELEWFAGDGTRPGG